MRVILLGFLLILSACVQNPYQNYPLYDPALEPPGGGEDPKLEVDWWLSTHFLGVHHWETTNFSIPERVPQGWKVSADVRVTPWDDLQDRFLPTTPWTRHTFLINGHVLAAEPPVADPNDQIYGLKPSP